MRIDSINRNQNIANNNFRGTVSPLVVQVIKNCAKNEARNYISTLDKGVMADKNILLKIQKSWDILLKSLEKKVEKAHKNTVLAITPLQDESEPIEELCFIFENKAIGGAYLVADSLSADEITGKTSFTSKDFKYVVDDIKPNEIDTRVLKSAIQTLLHKLKEGRLNSYGVLYPAIVNYQNEIGTISKKEAENNISRLKNAYEKVKNEILVQRTEENNNKLLDEIFGTTKL